MVLALKRGPRRARAVRRNPLFLVPRNESRARRLVDIAGAGLLLAAALPALLLGMLAVLASGRPIFFGHPRLGLAGRPFRCWKLRTMTPDAEARLEQEPSLRERYVKNGFKLPAHADPRITRVGRVLRRTYVDEIPQLFNVLRGEMSLFGPRPIVEAELRNYGQDADVLLRVKPGLFGAWTSLGPARPPYPERARLELEYVRTRTLAHDLTILLRSIPVVLRGQSERM